MERKDAKNSLENVVVKLTETEAFSLPKTDRLSGSFLVAKNLIFAKNFYGPVEVYSLKTGEKITRLHFSLCALRGDYAFAHDGEFIYFNIEGDFRVKDEDVILAQLPRDAGKFDCAKFDGRSVGEIRANPSTAKEGRIVRRIVSVPLDIFSGPSEIYDIEALLDSGNRFLVTNDMGLVNLLFSGPSYATLHYKADPNYEGLCDSSVFFKRGELFLPKGNEIEELHNAHISKRKILAGVNIEYSRSRETIVADNIVPFYDEKTREENDETFPLSVIFNNGAKSPNNIWSLKHQDDKVYVLTDRRISKGDRKGIIYVAEPHEFKTYQVELLKTSPVNSS